MRRQNNYIYNIALFAALTIPAAASAKATDSEQPIQIEADQVEIRDREGLSIYRGNVHIVQGTLRINGDEIRIHSTDDGLQKVNVLGKPASFFQLTDLNEEISAQGEKIEYQAKNNLLILERNAALVQRDNRFTSEHIVYDTQTNVVKAGAATDVPANITPPRVTITIMPDKSVPEKNTRKESKPTKKPETEKK